MGSRTSGDRRGSSGARPRRVVDEAECDFGQIPKQRTQARQLIVRQSVQGVDHYRTHPRARIPQCIIEDRQEEALCLAAATCPSGYDVFLPARSLTQALHPDGCRRAFVTSDAAAEAQEARVQSASAETAMQLVTLDGATGRAGVTGRGGRRPPDPRAHPRQNALAETRSVWGRSREKIAPQAVVVIEGTPRSAADARHARLPLRGCTYALLPTPFVGQRNSITTVPFLLTGPSGRLLQRAHRMSHFNCSRCRSVNLARPAATSTESAGNSLCSHALRAARPRISVTKRGSPLTMMFDRRATFDPRTGLSLSLQERS